MRTIAVVGPLADQVDVMLGNYNGRPTRPVTVLDGIRAAFPRARVVYAPGTRFLRTASTIPASALSTRDGRPGLQAQFRRGPGFTGAPALSRRDPELFYDRDMTPVIDADVISARWTGRVTAPETGEYAVGLAGSDARLWVDGVLQVATGAGSREPKLATLRLEAGRPRDIRIEQSPAKGLEIRLVWNRVVDRPMEQAMAAVRRADVVIAAVGITSALEGEEMTVTVPGFKGGDRTSLDLPAQEEALLEAVHGAGKPLAVVLMNGSALAVNWAATHADAILEAWYPGEQGGAAVGRALAGSDVPCGRLPVTVYTGVDQLPPFEDYAMAGRTYRYFAGKPLYPFGHGLSYTRFAYDGSKLSQASLAAGAPLVVKAQVRNIGRVAADEVAQLYLGFPRAPGLPLRALRGFTRVHLEPGETRRVRFDLDVRALSGVTEAGERVVAAGDYVVSVGGGQPGTDAPTVAAPLSIHGTARVDG